MNAIPEPVNTVVKVGNKSTTLIELVATQVAAQARIEALQDHGAELDRLNSELEDIFMDVTKMERITGELLDKCKAWIRRYIFVSDEQAVVLAAWILHTHAFDAAETTPYIHITAPDKECGKSRLMEVLEPLAANPVRSGGMTPAAMVRIIAAKRPTLFLDEMDTQLGGNKEYAETIRGVLNEGFRAKGVFYRCVGDDYEPTAFPVYSPKCIGGIGRLPHTVASRAIEIRMTRKLPGETIKAFRAREVAAAALPIKTAIEEWAARGIVTLLQGIRPAPIANLGDRQNDIVEPLLCIAQLAGDEWLQRLTESLKMIFNTVGEEDDSTGAALLTDVRAAFDDSKARFLTSTDLALELNAQEGHPWADWSNGRPMMTNQLARQLRKFRVYPTKVRFGSETVRGYRAEDFADSWARFCPEQSACSGSCSGCDKCSTAA